MDDFIILMVSAVAGFWLLALVLRALTLRYHFAQNDLTVTTFGVFVIQKLPFDEITLEAIGSRKSELPGLKERLRPGKITDLTHSIFSRWCTSGFLSTPDAIHIVPRSVARALASRNPPTRWNLLKAAKRRHLKSLPKRVVHSRRNWLPATHRFLVRLAKQTHAWPGRLRIGNITASALFVTIAIVQIGYAAGSISLLHQDMTKNAYPPALISQVLNNLIFHQFLQPVLSLLLGIWLLACAISRKTLPNLVVLLALLASFGGLYLSGCGGVHEMSHLVGDSCGSYPDTVQVYLWIAIACCGMMLTKPVIEWLLQPASPPTKVGGANPPHHSSPRP